tara:strand:- start:440 stop:1384 length:945 start_codon:yes stop_codon:yes gene_type:complete
MSSNLKVNTILPSTGDTVAISGIASVTSSISIASSCTATTFYGSGANLTSLPSQVTISNNGNDRIITGGSGTNLNGEGNFTFDGTTVKVLNTIPKMELNDGGGRILQVRGGSTSHNPSIVTQYASPLYLGSNNTESVNIGTEHLTITDGNLIVASGHGIDFSAKTVAGDQGTASASVLDDFEEGTFTCTLSGSSGGSITAARAVYTKIGNMVMCEVTFVNPGNNSVSGNWTMSLPFQFIGGGSGSYGGGKVTYTRYVPALTGGFQSYTIFTYYGQGVAYLYKLGTNGSSESQWMGGSVNNSLLFSFTMTYTTGT